MVRPARAFSAVLRITTWSLLLRFRDSVTKGAFLHTVERKTAGRCLRLKPVPVLAARECDVCGSNVTTRPSSKNAHRSAVRCEMHLTGFQASCRGHSRLFPAEPRRKRPQTPCALYAGVKEGNFSQRHRYNQHYER